MGIGIDAHKRTHTAVLVDELGKYMSAKTAGMTSPHHLKFLRWARQRAPERIWAIEDGRHLTRQLERDLLAAGESVVRVPPNSWHMLGIPLEHSANPIRSTHLPSHAPHCANLTCPSPAWTGRIARSVC